MVYEGEVLDGLRHGQGAMTFADSPASYVGEWAGGVRHGTGTAYFDAERKSYYEGQWCRDQKHGVGRMQYPSGNVYEGGWRDDRKHGPGTMHWRSLQQQYTGMWEDDLPNGLGTHVWLRQVVDPAGTTKCHAQYTQYNRYHGYFVRGRRHGYGVLHYATGAAYEGWWQDDLKHGPGIFVFEDGTSFSGAFDGDRPVLPPGKSFGPESPGVQVPVPDLVASEERPGGVAAAVNSTLMLYNTDLRALYDKFSRTANAAFLPPAGLSRFSSSMLACQFWDLVRDCRLLGPDLSLCTVDDILRTARQPAAALAAFRQKQLNERRDVEADRLYTDTRYGPFICQLAADREPPHSPTAELLFREFCCALVRLAHVKHAQLPHLDQRVAALITKTIVPYNTQQSPNDAFHKTTFQQQYESAGLRKYLQLAEHGLSAMFMAVAQPAAGVKVKRAAGVTAANGDDGEEEEEGLQDTSAPQVSPQAPWAFETTPRAVLQLLQSRGVFAGALTPILAAAACAYNCLSVAPDLPPSSLAPGSLMAEVAPWMDSRMAYQEFVEALVRCADLALDMSTTSNLLAKVKTFLGTGPLAEYFAAQPLRLETSVSTMLLGKSASFASTPVGGRTLGPVAAADE